MNKSTCIEGNNNNLIKGKELVIGMEVKWQPAGGAEQVSPIEPVDCQRS